MPLTVMTWNVENLFRPGGNFGPDSAAVYDKKLSALAATITASGAAVVAVQEVGDADAVADLVTRIGGVWHTVLSEQFDAHHPIRVGVLSTLLLQTVADVADYPAALGAVRTDDAGAHTTRMGRGALAARVQPASGPPILVVACHLKSKLLSFPAPPGKTRFNPRDEGERARYATYALHRRAAEAVTARALVDQLLDGEGRTRPLILAGDLNDEPTAATTQILQGPPGSELGAVGADRPDVGDASRLWNLAARIPDGQRFSRIYRGRGELIDHLLVSHALLAKVDRVWTIGEGQLASIDDDPNSRRGNGGSDHAPVLVHIRD